MDLKLFFTTDSDVILIRRKLYRVAKNSRQQFVYPVMYKLKSKKFDDIKDFDTKFMKE